MADTLELLEEVLPEREVLPTLPETPAPVLPETPADVLPETALTLLRLELLPLVTDLELTLAELLLPGCGCGARELNEPAVLLRLTLAT